MRTLYALGLLVAGAGGAALGTRVPADTTTTRTEYVTRPDSRVAPLTLRVGELEREVQALERAPKGLDGQRVRALIEQMVGPQVPEETTTDETTTTTTEAQRDG